MKINLLLLVAVSIVLNWLQPPIDIGLNYAVIDPATAAIIGGGTIIGSLVSGLFGSSSQREANQMQYDMWQKEFNYTKYNDEKNRWFVLDQAKSQRDWQEQHDIDMFNLDAQNRSYKEQRRQMEEAGLNPSMMFAGGNLVQPASATSSTGAAAATPSSGSLPSIPKIEPETSAAAETIKATSGAIKDIASALNESAQADATREKLAPEIEHLKESVNTMQSQQRVNDSIVSLNNAEEQYKLTLNSLEEIRKKYADQKEFATINNICAETQKYLADAYLAGLQGETEIANAALRNAEASLMKFKETSEREQLPLILSNLKKQGKLIDAQAVSTLQQGAASLESANAQKIIAFATDAEKREQVEFLKKQGEYFKKLSFGQSIQNAHDFVTFKERVETTIEVLKQEKLITSQQFNQLRLLAKQNNWYETMQAFHILTGGLIGAGQAMQGAAAVTRAIPPSKPSGKIGF